MLAKLVVSAGFFLVGVCGQTTKTASSVTFSATKYPLETEVFKFTNMHTESIATVNYNDGTSTTSAFTYKPWFKTGELVPNGEGGFSLSGGYYDSKMAPIIDTSGPAPRQFYSDCPDGMSVMSTSMILSPPMASATVRGVKGNTVFAVVQFEYLTANQAGASMYGLLPSIYGVLTLDQDKTTGELSLVKYSPVDTSKAYGIWIPCAASLSPWGTHLSSEEYEPNTNALATSFLPRFSTYYYGAGAVAPGQTAGLFTHASPYLYGHIPEVTVNADGTGTVKKHFCLGRISHELVQVMGDEKTVLMGDDATNSGFFAFIADTARDLSSGTLYVAKLAASTDILSTTVVTPMTWIKLGKATSKDVETWALTTKLSDIMDVRTTDPVDTTFTKIFYGGTAEWIKLNTATTDYLRKAAFLETHRYAYYVGATMIFTKMEGTTVNLKDKVAYYALQNCEKSMVAGQSSNNGLVSIPKTIKSGAVMKLQLGSATEIDGITATSIWMPVSVTALLVGEDLTTPTAFGDSANVDKVANPDNIKFSEVARTLFIGEDCSQHVTCQGWAYNVDTKLLSRTLTAPTGAELTGLGAYDNINGFAYYTSNFQHAGDYSDTYYVDGILAPYPNPPIPSTITGSMFTKARATGDTLLRLLWNQESPVYHNGIVATVNTGLQGYYRGQATVGYMKGSPAEMTFSVTTPAAPTSAPISVPVTTSNIIGTNAAGSNACFAASETVTMENGQTKAISEVQVGDRILSADVQGKTSFSDVVYVPHSANIIEAMFVVLTTESGRSVKMTTNHILPAGQCGAAMSVRRADAVSMGDCVMTVDGAEKVMDMVTMQGKGIYTVVTNEEYLVVNGIVATPFGGINPTLANIYYNLHRLMYALMPKMVMASQLWVQGVANTVASLVL